MKKGQTTSRCLEEKKKDTWILQLVSAIDRHEHPSIRGSYLLPKTSGHIWSHLYILKICEPFEISKEVIKYSRTINHFLRYL